jgi:hypothetical protein
MKRRFSVPCGLTSRNSNRTTLPSANLLTRTNLIEVYLKADKEIEDRKRLLKYYKRR